MEKKLKIIVSDDSTELGQACSKAFKAYGMSVLLCPKDGKALLKAVKENLADVVLADVFMPNIDILGVIDGIKKLNLQTETIIMAMSAFDNTRLEKELLDGGVDYYFLKPFDANTVAERIIQLSGRKSQNLPLVIRNSAVSDPQLEVMITDIMHQIGVPAHIKG